MTKTSGRYVITGGPSSGKTTLIKELEARGFKTIQEAARTLIDEAAEKGISAKELRNDEELFQHNVAKLKAKIEKELDKDLPVFFDRGMQDTLAYLNYYDYQVQDWEEELFENSVYDKVFLLEPLPVFEKDYARTEDDAFANSMHSLLHDAYAKFGMEPTKVPVMSLKDRTSFILEHI